MKKSFSSVFLFVDVSDTYSVSIEMELLVEELKEQHQDLKIQLETKVRKGRNVLKN